MSSTGRRTFATLLARTSSVSSSCLRRRPPTKSLLNHKISVGSFGVFQERTSEPHFALLVHDLPAGGRTRSNLSQPSHSSPWDLETSAPWIHAAIAASFLRRPFAAFRTHEGMNFQASLFSTHSPNPSRTTRSAICSACHTCTLGSEGVLSFPSGVWVAKIMRLYCGLRWKLSMELSNSR